MDETLEEFEKKRRRLCALANQSDSPMDKEEVRIFVLKCIDPKDNYYHVYRASPKDYRIEDDLHACLPAFSDSLLAPYQLKLLRRFAFQRYAFDLAKEINQKLREAGANSRWARFWLAKDHFLPRVPLSMLIGFALVLGAGHLTDWLGELATGFWGFSGTVILGLAATFFLVYLNVRDQLGNVSQVWARTGRVLAICLGWLILALGAIALVGTRIQAHFDYRHGIAIGIVALVLAILGQFFFAREGSIADPL